MGSGIFFPICAIPFSLLIMILFFKKGHINNSETKIYQSLIVINFIGLIIEILCTFASIIYNQLPLLSNFIYKSYLVYLITWTSLFTLYIYKISSNFKDKMKKKNKKILILMFILTILVTYILPIELVVENNFQTRYTTGMSVNFVYLVSGALVLAIILMLIKNRKHVLNKRYIPVFVFLVVGTLAIFIQNSFPQLLLQTYVETLICVIMYFTIENPDVMVIEELYKNRKLVKQSVEGKSNFLFYATQKMRKPINDIIIDTNNLLEEKNKDKLYEGIKIINFKTRQVSGILNEILDISKMDAKKIKISKETYNIYNMFDSIKLKIEKEVNKNVVFRTNISKEIPELLYGDSIKLKQMITSILLNSCEHTKEGFITFDINCIVKYDVCRLIINIEDTGIGIDVNKINDILSENNELTKEDEARLDSIDINLKMVKKVINLLGGSLLIDSQAGIGTDIIITLDQKISNKNTSKLEKKYEEYEKQIYNNKKVLYVDNDNKNIKKVKKILEEMGVELYSSLYIEDCIKKIESKEEYNFILVNDLFGDESATELLKRLKEIPKFKIPVYVIISSSKERFGKHYIKDGFKDFILEEKIEQQLKELIKD